MSNETHITFYKNRNTN